MSQTFTALQYLQMDIAASFGLDKSSWNDRLHWFKTNERLIAENPSCLTTAAEEPAQFMAGAMAYRATLAGQPTGYLCGLDATASGLQLLALLAGCEQSASICNLIDTGRREDAYNLTYSHMNELLGTSGNVPRKGVKQSLMTHLYGSKAVPRQTFGEDTAELAAFYQTIDALLPGADQLNHDLVALWNPQALAHSWTLPDGFDVVVKVMDTVSHEVTILGKTYTVNERVNQPMASGLSLGANIIHSIDGLVVREMNRRCNFTAAKVVEIQDLLESDVLGGVSSHRTKDLSLLRLLALQEHTGFMSAVIFEHLDKDNIGHLSQFQGMYLIDLINTMPMVSFPLICIHDCFKFHANYGNDVRNQYKQILAELAGSDVLSAIASEISEKPINVNKLSNTLPEKILASNYAIC